MAEAKTQKTDASVDDFLAGISPEKKRQDALALCELMKKVTKAKPAMWGESIVGFGSYMYKYASGHEGEWPLAGFSPRKQNLTVYLMPGFDKSKELLARLGKHKTSKACLYFNTLDDIHVPTLRQLIQHSFTEAKRTLKPDDGLPKIGNPATRALATVGITRLSQLTKVSKAYLLRLHGVGPKAVGILEEALAARGKAFAKAK